MNVSQIRMQNYLALRKRLREKEDAEGIPQFGELSRFAKLTGVAVQYLSHLNNGRKNMGHACARKLEAAFKLPDGWMDADHLGGATVMDSRAKDFGSMAMRLYEQDPEGVRELLMHYMEDKLFNKKLPSENGNGKH